MTVREKRRRGDLRRVVSPAVLCVWLALLLAAATLGGAARAEDASEARRHAQRATGLAASGKCRQAVVEFDKALAILRDPALLFNRAECHRKLGDGDAALDDYKQFLSDLPGAPNRAEVEERIADLQRRSAAAVAADAAPATGPAKDTVAPREIVLAPSPAEGDSDSGDADHRGGAIATASDRASASSSNPGVTGQPWFWIAVSVLAVGVGVGAFVLLNGDSTNVPSSALGNYKF